MNLPSPIRAYFDADERADGEALIQAFASNATVKDESRTYAGQQAVAAWWRETKDKYQAVLVPLEANDEDGVTTVRARVTGQFPGSPVMMSFKFQLADDGIARLDIEA